MSPSSPPPSLPPPEAVTLPIVGLSEGAPVGFAVGRRVCHGWHVRQHSTLRSYWYIIPHPNLSTLCWHP